MFWATWGNSPSWEVDILKLYSRLAVHQVNKNTISAAFLIEYNGKPVNAKVLIVTNNVPWAFVGNCTAFGSSSLLFKIPKML